MIDSGESGERTSKVWETLAKKFASLVDDAAEIDPGKAIILACCAEACFWKATGEADAHDIKDVLLFFGQPRPAPGGDGKE